MKQHPTENIWSFITMGLFGLSLVDKVLIGAAVVSLIISSIVNWNAYKKDNEEKKAAEAQRKYYENKMNEESN